jgi:hypothetical protein
MCTPTDPSYALVATLVTVLLGAVHPASLTTTTDLVYALLQSQSLHPAALVRALPHPATRRARQAFRRVRRHLRRPTLGSLALTPRLRALALAWVGDAEVTLVLDSTRCTRWELFTLGVRWHQRVLPIAWTVLAYPWPKGTFTPTVVQLIDRVLADWPPARPVHLVADRGFPSRALLRSLDRWRTQLPLGYTLRLRASDHVAVPSGERYQIGVLAATLTAGAWLCRAATYERTGDDATCVTLVIGHNPPAPPPHQRGPADQARRQQRAAARRAHIASKHQNPAHDRVWALLTTASSPTAACARYAQRFATEGTYRDLKEWDLEAVMAQTDDLALLDGLVGLASLAYLLQLGLGVAAGQTDDASARARQQLWSTTDRLSSFWRGRQVLHDHAHDWHPWIAQTLVALQPAPDAMPPRPVRQRQRAHPHPEAA